MVASADVSVGQQLLIAAGSTKVLVAACGISKCGINNYKRGYKTPGPDQRLMLERAFGISPTAWDDYRGQRLPHGTPRPDTGRGLPCAPLPDPLPEPVEIPKRLPEASLVKKLGVTKPQTPAFDEPRLVRASTLEDACALIDQIRLESKAPGIMKIEKARLRDAEARAIALRAKLERDQEMSEDRIVRDHPFWRRLHASILHALRPFPEASKAVADELKHLL